MRFPRPYWWLLAYALLVGLTIILLVVTWPSR